MSKKKTHWDWNQEFKTLLEGPRNAPPKELTLLIKKRIETELNPSGGAVFFKLFVIHFISGTLTLFVCPQFGMAFNGKNHSLLNLFQGFGEYGCMLICGAFFLGGTGLFSALLLKAQEVRTIRKSKQLQWALLSFLSVGFFLALQEQERSIPVGLAVTWVVGALLGGASVFGMSYELRSRLRRRLAL